MKVIVVMFLVMFFHLAKPKSTFGRSDIGSDVRTNSNSSIWLRNIGVVVVDCQTSEGILVRTLTTSEPKLDIQTSD